MKTTLQKAFFLLALLPAFMNSQIDLSIGLNYGYDPPSNCNNTINNLEIDVCNNGSSSAGAFLVGIYLYKPSSQEYWVVDQTTINSLSGSACITISNWDIDMSTYPSLPAPGTDYRIGVWVDTANVISESDEDNNAALLSGNIQVCAVGGTGIKDRSAAFGEFRISPQPVSSYGDLSFNILREENMNVSVFDLNGKKVNEVFNGKLMPGNHKISFDVNSLSGGVYLLKAQTSSGYSTRKLVVQH